MSQRRRARRTCRRGRRERCAASPGSIPTHVSGWLMDRQGIRGEEPEGSEPTDVGPQADRILVQRHGGLTRIGERGRKI
jgi:hypothetical protein